MTDSSQTKWTRADAVKVTLSSAGMCALLILMYAAGYNDGSDKDSDVVFNNATPVLVGIAVVGCIGVLICGLWKAAKA